MNIIFVKPGKYDNNYKTVIVSLRDIESKKIFQINDRQAAIYIDKGKAHKEGDKPVVKKYDSDTHEADKIKEELKELGVTVHPKTGIDKLKEKLEEAKKDN